MIAQKLSLKQLEPILEALATDPRGPADATDTAYSAWVRDTVCAAGTKLRVLRYMLENASPVNGHAPRLLDVGAQLGVVVAYASTLGFRTAAVDYPLLARRFGPILEQFGVEYRACDVAREALPFEDGSFEFVTYMDVIEHHAFSPKRVLREIHRVLAARGRVIVTTPNHASIYNRFSLLMGRSVHDDFSYYFDSCAADDPYPGHHREYTRNELCRALEATSFRVLKCSVIDEDPASYLYCVRRRCNSSVGAKAGCYLMIAVALLGRIWPALHLPFGRLLWAVAEKA